MTLEHVINSRQQADGRAMTGRRAALLTRKDEGGIKRQLELGLQRCKEHWTWHLRVQRRRRDRRTRVELTGCWARTSKRMGGTCGGDTFNAKPTHGRALTVTPASPRQQLAFAPPADKAVHHRSPSRHTLPCVLPEYAPSREGNAV